MVAQGKTRLANKNKVIVIGGGGHAKVIINMLKRINTFNILGYIDTHDTGDVTGIGYLGNHDVLKEIKQNHSDCSAVLGIGNINIADSEKRAKIKEDLKSLGYDLPTLIAPTAIVNSDVKIGKGTVIVDGAIINPGTRIGECAIINTSSSIDHDCVIGDCAHIAPGAILSGGVEVGDNSIIGAGAIIIQYKKISENCIVGAGATVVKDCTTPGVYVGTPAKRRG